MVPVQVRLTKKLIENVDDLVSKGVYSNRSEVIRDAIRRHVVNFGETDPNLFRREMYRREV